MIKFTKMHGAGNDYVYVNCFEQEISDPEALSVFVSERHFGIGADGLVLITPSNVADFRMRMFNADGSEGKMCGNAARCVGKYVFDHKMTDKTVITLETLSGIKTLDMTIVNGLVSEVLVDMGIAVLNPKDIPVNIDNDKVIGYPLEVDGTNFDITCVSMGNPHAVIFVDNIDDLDLEKIGPKFENHQIFPQRVNTEFIKIVDNNTLAMRVWERGSGETWACGTGACAAVVAAVLNGHCKIDTEVNVILRGGTLKITYKSDGHVLMKGGATEVFSGVLKERKV